MVLLFHFSEICSCRVPPKAEGFRVFTDWHICYHGTAPETVRRIVECGDLLAPG